MIILSKMETENIRDTVKSFKGYGASVIAVSNDRLVEKELGIESIVFNEELPSTISPIFYAVPIQLYAYYSSIYRGLNPDKPEKLSKVVE